MVFCKAPVAGEVKTRLTRAESGDKAFTAEEAALIHQQLAAETLQDGLALQKLVQSDDLRLELWCSPDTRHNFFQQYVASGYSLKQQVGADLGERMAAGFTGRHGAALLIGTDCPGITAEYLHNAFKALQTADLVLGPAEDGGYGLIGLNRAAPTLFEDVPWSTEEVLQVTIRKAEDAGLRVMLLPEIWDVDHPADVERWQRLNAAGIN
jgi:hypothetical protein